MGGVDLEVRELKEFGDVELHRVLGFMLFLELLFFRFVREWCYDGFWERGRGRVWDSYWMDGA